MSLLQRVLFPFVREFWIGRTFVHRAGQVSAVSHRPLAADLELSLLGPEDIEAIRHSPTSDIERRCTSFAPGVRHFGARLNGDLVGLCTFAFGEEYLHSGGFYDLAQNEAELADVFTSPLCRGRGIAGVLIRYSTERMHEEGFQTLFAKVWHSNAASSQAFRGAGWEESCFFIRLYPRGTTSVWHTEWRRPRSAATTPVVSRPSP
jgi:GNAT superfamily N-acetyltransferase